MSNLLKCCCDVVTGYYLLQPCFNTEVSQIVYMPSADFLACGFTELDVYKWDSSDPSDDPYCGFWLFAPYSGDFEDTDCSNYTLNTEGCCGGDCFTDDECCGFDQCFDWYQTNALELAEVTGYSGGSGSQTDWSVAISNVSVSSWYWTGGDFNYDVTVDITITVSGIGSLTCDGNSNFTTAGSFTFTVTHSKGVTCLESSDSGLTYPDPDCGIRVCTGTTSDGITDTSDCSQISVDVGTLSATTPNLGDNCQVQSTYSLTVPIDYNLVAGNQSLCTDCDSDGRWASAAFPDVNISTTLTLVGTWAP